MFREDNDFEDLNEMHQKISNQSFNSFEERKDDINKSKNVFVGAVAGITLAAIVGWLVLSPRYDNTSETDIPVVRRPQNVAKLQPTDPGGMEILNQDKTVYDIIEKKGDDTSSIESLLPPPEEPKMPEVIETVSIEETNIVATEEEVEMVKQVEEIKEEAPKGAESIMPEVKTVVVKEEVKTVEVKEVKPAPEKIELPKKIEVAQIEEPKEPTKKYSFDDFKQVNTANPGRYVIENTESPLVDVSDSEFESEMRPQAAPAKTAAAPATKTASKGTWQVQLMSSPNKAAVESSWSSQVKKYNVLSGQTYEIETADLGAKGTYYRLKAGSFSGRADADSLCNDIKAMGGSCLVTQKK